MKTMVKYCVICFCLCLMVFSGQSQASPPAKHDATSEKWEYYASDEENTEYSYNAGTVERHGNTVKVWVQAKYSEKNLKYSDGRFQWEIDCQKKQMRGLQAYAKKKDGTSAVVTESSDWAIIPSESTAETLYEKVCKKPAQKTDKKAADKKSKEKQAEKKAP